MGKQWWKHWSWNSSNVVTTSKYVCGATGSYLWDPQKGEEAEEVAVQKQWQRHKSHATGSRPASYFFPLLLMLWYSSVIKWWERRECNVSLLSVFDCQVPSCISSQPQSQSYRLHASNPNLSTAESNTQEVCPESPESPADASHLQKDFCQLANSSESFPGLL